MGLKFSSYNSSDLNFSLLEIGDVKILLECGLTSHSYHNLISSIFHQKYPDALNNASYKYLLSIANSIDLILISGSELEHIGLLPFITSYLSTDCAILATVPVVSLTRTFLTDLYRSIEMTFGAHDPNTKSEFLINSLPNLYSYEAMEKALLRFVPLRYQQSVEFSGRLSGIKFVPICSGCFLGGAIWKIQQSTGDYIVYLPSLSCSRRLLVPSSNIFSLDLKPKILICSCKDSIAVNEPFIDKAHEFLGYISKYSSAKLAEGFVSRSIIIPVEANSSCIEILYMLDNYRSCLLNVSIFKQVNIFFLSSVCNELILCGRTSVEWFQQQAHADLFGGKKPVTSFENIICINDTAQMDLIIPNSFNIVVGTISSLEAGFLKQFLLKLSNADMKQKTEAIFLFTKKPSPDTFASLIFQSNEYISILVDTREKVALGDYEVSSLKKHAEFLKIKQELKHEFDKLITEFKTEKDNFESNDEKKLLKDQVRSTDALTHLFWTSFFESTFCADFSNAVKLDQNSKAKDTSFKTFRTKSFFNLHDDYGTSTQSKKEDINTNFRSEKERDTKILNENGSFPEYKWINRQQNFSLHYKKDFINLDWQNDNRYIKFFGESSLPKHLLLFGGDKNSKTHLYNHFSLLLVPNTEIINCLECETVSIDFKVLSLNASLNAVLPTEILNQSYSMTTVLKACLKFFKNDKSISVNRYSSFFTEFVNFGDFRLTEIRQILKSSGFEAFADAGEIRIDKCLRIFKKMDSIFLDFLYENTNIYEIRELFYQDINSVQILQEDCL